jgi:Zn-dependent M28 family amino/carboxypeptidase
MSSIETLTRVVATLACAAVLAACDREDPAAGGDAPTSVTAVERITQAAVTAAERITGDELRRVVAEIASDEYGGRSPGSSGEIKAREFLARELAALGFGPAGENGSYEQAVELVGVTTNAPPTWRFQSQREAVELANGTDFIAVSGVQDSAAALANAELVFVGYGIVAPEYDWNDFKDVDVRGKVLVMLNNDPDWDPALFAGFERLYYGRWTYKYESAAAHGAAGAIIVHTTPSAGYGWNVVQSSWSGPQFELPAAGEPRTQVRAWVTEDAARRLVGAAHDFDALVEQAKRRDFAPVPLGVTTSLALTNSLTRTPTANVLGVMRGTDPALAAQHVIYSAHYDHLGIGEPNAEGDTIYNGARDNASGVAMLLAIGRAFAALPEKPSRSIMLLFVAAEEQGLIGSQYYAEHPTVPAGLIAANVNFDSGNIWGETRDITYLGLGKSTLDAVARDVGTYQGRTVLGDQFPDRGYYYRSDQFNFAKIGVPAFYLRGGTDFVGRPAGWGAEQLVLYEERDYHQASDELTPEWDFAGMVQDAKFGFHAGLLVANDDALPQWNAGNEFEAARRAALEAAGTR